MAKLPSIADIERPIPQGARAMVGGAPGNTGAVLSQIGATGEKLAGDWQEKQDKLDTIYADAHLIKSQAEVMDSMKDEQDPEKIRSQYVAEMTRHQNDSAALIRNPQAKQLFLAQSNLHLASSLTQVNSLVELRKKEQGQAKAAESFDGLIDTASGTPDPTMSKSLLNTANNIVDASVQNGFYTPLQGYEMKKKGAEKYGENWLAAKPYDEQLKLLTPSVTKNAPDSAIATVLNNEGGYVPIDGSSGAPAIYGINQKWHPEEYGKAKQITDEKGADAGKQYAQEFYKAEYWDKKGIGNLPAATQTIVMDGVINHSKSFGDKLVEAAKSGTPPEALIQMRRDEYKRLAEANPEKYGASLDGWNKRLDKITSGEQIKSGTPLDFIPFDKRLELQKRAQTALKADIELRDKDPMTYAQVHGLTPNQPLDFSNPDTLRTQMDERAKAAVRLNVDHGAPLKVMTDNEAKALTTRLQGMNTTQQLGLLNELRLSGDSQIYQAALQQIRPDSPVTAMAGMYLGLNRDLTTETHWFRPNETITPEYVAANLLQGEALLNPTKAEKKENGIGKEFPMPSDGTPNQPGLRAAFNDYVGDSFRGQPEAQDQAYQAYRAFYAAEAAKSGDYSGALNSDIADKSAKAVVGAVADSGNNKVIAPWGMDETAFRDETKIRYDDLKKIYNLPADYNDITLENTGEAGTYRAQVGAGYLVDDKGKPIVIRLQ